jgi:quinol monooxygenase YgiN
MLPRSRGRVLETMRYRVAPAERDSFLDAMQHVQHAHGRAGALDWRLYEDVANPEGWLEAWTMESWTDHSREASRLSDSDRQVLARVSAFHDAAAPLPCRYIAVEPGPRALNHPICIAASLATQPGPAR